jgi:hypothetical protein
MIGSGAAHSVRSTRRRRQARANPRSFLRDAMGSFGGELYQMVGDLRPTVGMTNPCFRQNREKQDPFEAPGNAARRQPHSSKDAVTRKQTFTGQRRARYVPSALPRSTFTACPDGIVQ